MATDDPMMRVRLPSPLKARIAEAAQAAGRSMNAEIVQRLEASFMPAGIDREATAAFMDGAKEAFREAILAAIENGIHAHWKDVAEHGEDPEWRARIRAAYAGLVENGPPKLPTAKD